MNLLKGGGQKAPGLGLVLVLALVLVLPVFLLLLPGCGGDRPEEQRGPELRLAFVPGADAVPLVLALEDGDFQAAGVTVELLPVQSREEAERALMAGSVHGALLDLFSVVELQRQGFYVVATSATPGTWELVSTPGEELAPGSRVALPEGPLPRYLLEKLAGDGGVPLAELEVVLFPGPEQALEAFKEGKTEAAFLPYPYKAGAPEKDPVTLASTLRAELFSGALVFGGEVVEDCPEGLLSFYRGYRAALASLREGRAGYRDLLVKGSFPEWWPEPEQSSWTGIRLPTRAEVEEVGQWLAAREGFPRGDMAYELLVREVEFLP